MSRHRIGLVAVMALAAALRLSGIGWDGWHHQHPDERFLVMVAERLSLPGSIAEAFDPERSPANPNNQGFSFYVYGALPPQAAAAVASLLGMKSYGGLLVVGRLLAVGVDLLALYFMIALGARLGGEKAGLLAGVLYAACALAIQQSRFATCDVWGVACVVALAWAVVARPLRSRDLVVAGVALGLAAACRPNLLLAAVIPTVAIMVAAARREDETRGRRTAWQSAAWGLGSLAVVAVTALVVLKVADPGAFASTLSPLPSPRRLASLHQLSALAAGGGQFPPNLQWADRRSVLDPLANLLLWGAGPALGMLLPLALGRQLRRAVLGDVTWLPLLAWVVPMGVWHLSRFVCAVRYFEPLLPFALIAVGCWLARQRRRAVVGAVVGLTLAWGVLWASLAWREYTRVEASRWLRDNLLPGSAVTFEYWDDALPLPGEGPPGVATIEMPVFAPDTREKREVLLDALDRADAVVLASQRGVGSICRVPDAYPLTSEYYHLLFSGALGFRQDTSIQRRIGIGPLSLSDLGAEESLSVYDHPPVWIFRKTAAYDRGLVRSLLERVELPGSTTWDTASLEARGQPPYQQRWDDGRPLPALTDPGWLRQALLVMLWIAVLELAGLAGHRLLLRLGVVLPDGGWGVARWFGLAAVGVVWLWLGWMAVPGWSSWLPTAAVIAAAPWGVAELRRMWRDPAFRSTAIPVWLVLAGFLAVRAANPEIYWGEKPMDAAILGGIMRSGSLPPSDPWFAGAPLNYYFFGFLPIAFLARATGTPLGLAYNLAVATVPALAFGSAMSVGWLVAGRRLGGLLAGVLAQLTGSMSVLFSPGLLLHPDFARFWATTRVIGTTINEYPVWTALFADLHAHFLGFPGFLAGVLVASAVALRRVPLRAGAVLGGAIVAVEAMTNTWEAPVLAGLLTAAVLLAPVTTTARRRVALVTRALGLALATAAVLALPFWMTVRTATARVALNRLMPPPAASFLQLFGIPLALTLIAAAVAVRSTVRGRAVVWGWWLVAVGGALIMLPELVTVADRMNTVFKLHLQAHLLLGAALGATLAAALPGVASRWRNVAWVAVAVTVALGLTTAAACAWAVTHTRRVPGPRPTLDGQRYLDDAAPQQAALLRDLAALPLGGTVMETPGTPYSDSMRVPMFTGRPGLVGWEYHLWQRNHARAEILLRRHDLERLRSGNDRDVVAALARRYRVVAACEWAGWEPVLATLPGWRVVAAPGGAVLAFASEGGEP